MKRCEVCQENPSKYRCPCCELQTCCLQCVNKHKADTGCTGQRDKTIYLAVKEFRDIHLLSDYRFLEEAGRKKNNAGRDNLKRKHFKPNFLKELEKQASQRKIDLRIMPYPMSRRKNNYTTYQCKSRSILWQIEWKFPQVDLTLLDQRVPEGNTMESILDKHTGVDADPIVKHKLRPYIQAGPDKWGLFMKVENISKSEEKYHRLDLTKTVTENLANKCVIEYPTIHVVLEQQWSQYNTEGVHCEDSVITVTSDSGDADNGVGDDIAKTTDAPADHSKLILETQNVSENKITCSY